jgi:hypothetical protein
MTMETMKILKVTLLICGLFTSLIIQAKETDRMVVITTVMPQKRVVLRISDAPKKSLELNIRNSATGEMVYEGKMSEDISYIKVFNLSNLPEGEYDLTVETEEKVYRKYLAVNRATCHLLSESEYHKPVFDNEDGSLRIAFSNPEDEKLTISFRNSLGTFFKDEANQVKVFKRKYNLAMLEPGDYHVDLLAGEDTYSYYFEIR